MELKYNVTGARRKELVSAIAEITGAEKEYLGAPTFAYRVDYFTIDKNGTVSFDDRADSEEIETLIDRLSDMGFEAEDAESNGLTVEIPLENVQVGNLKNLLNAKGSLIKKALSIPDTPIEITEDTVKFPWFSELPEADAIGAYTHFISALCEMSVAQKRITAKEKPIDNEKYAFRCFLLRLGFIGDEYKAERKILLRNLTGSSAFKSGAKKEAANSVTTVCYGETQAWDSRDEAIAFFLQAMAGSEGSERERYSNIYTRLITGEMVCSDE